MTDTFYESEWLVELRHVLVTQYEFTEDEAAQYGHADHWWDYYNEDYLPSEAVAEDSTYWAEAA